MFYPLDWELPYAMGVALEMAKRKKKSNPSDVLDNFKNSIISIFTFMATTLISLLRKYQLYRLSVWSCYHLKGPVTRQTQVFTYMCEKTRALCLFDKPYCRVQTTTPCETSFNLVRNTQSNPRRRHSKGGNENSTLKNSYMELAAIPK